MWALAHTRQRNAVPLESRLNTKHTFCVGIGMGKTGVSSKNGCYRCDGMGGHPSHVPTK